jgi:hypothetical protein
MDWMNPPDASIIPTEDVSMLRNRTADLNGPIGPHRRWSWARSSLADVKQIRQALPGTVNDVVLAVITRGFRDLLLGRGAEVDGRVVRTLVPVPVRSEQERGTYNNRASGMFPDLPEGFPGGCCLSRGEALDLSRIAREEPLGKTRQCRGKRSRARVDFGA